MTLVQVDTFMTLVQIDTLSSRRFNFDIALLKYYFLRCRCGAMLGQNGHFTRAAIALMVERRD